MFVPVVDENNRPMMPTTASRAKRWIKSGKATPFLKKGVFCVRLNQEPSSRNTQPIAVGIDPGSKREGFTVKSKSHTYLNIQAHAVDWVKDHVETRLEFHRRQLHRLQHSTGHIRSRYGGTISAGFKRGSVVKHSKLGFCYVGGWQESPTKKDPNRKTISLHSLNTGKRLTQNAIPNDCIFKTYGSWRISTPTKVAVSLTSLGSSH